MSDPRIKKVKTMEHKEDDDSALVHEIVLENIWNEKFRIEYVKMPLNQLAAHAVKI
jgi:hypothetical protein